MNRNLLLLLCVVLASAGYYFYSSSTPNGNKPELKDFAWSDTNSLTKIFMADRHGHQITLARTGDGWLVNDHHEAHVGYLKQLLNTIARLRVKNPLPNGMFASVVKDIAANHTKVELYTGEGLVKTYFVGGPTQAGDGTYMLMLGSSTPFVCEVPGFAGFVTPQYVLDEKTWRNKRIFKVPPDSLFKVSLFYADEPAAGFQLSWKGTDFLLANTSGKSHNAVADTGMVRYYRGLFQSVYAEAFGTVEPGENSDSIYNSPVWCRLSLSSTNQVTILTIHRKQVDIRTKMQYDNQGRPNQFDTERYYAFLNQSREPMLIQDFVFANILRKLPDFVRKSATGS